MIAQGIEELVGRPGLELDRFKGSTVLVAGGNSLIGKHLVWLFCHLNEHEGFAMTVYVLVRNLEKAHQAFGEWADKGFLFFLHQDVRDPIELPADPPPAALDFIFHLASSASARLIAEDPVGIIQANTAGTVNILELARTAGAKHVVFASTREVYGALPAGTTRISEDDMGTLDPVHPRNSYPESKRAAEALLVAYAQQHGVPYTILRIAHTYGPGMDIGDDGRIMADILGAVVRREDVVLTSDGSARRGFCYVTDCIDGILRAMLSETEVRVFNLANETEQHAVRTVARMAVEAFPEHGLKVRFSAGVADTSKRGYNPIPLVPLDTAKIEALGWRPFVTLREGMRRTVLSFQ